MALLTTNPFVLETVRFTVLLVVCPGCTVRVLTLGARVKLSVVAVTVSETVVVFDGAPTLVPSTVIETSLSSAMLGRV